MIELRFGNYPVDMSNPDFLPDMLGSSVASHYTYTPSVITAYLSNGSSIAYFGSFDYTNLDTLRGSLINGVQANDSSSNLVLSFTGLPPTPLSQFREIDDAIQANNLPTAVYGSPFNDVLVLESADDPESKNTRDYLLGMEGDDDLRGAGGNDTLDGGTGNDLLAGGAGDDLYLIDAGDTLIESADEGVDTVRAGFSHSLADPFENLILTGTGDFHATGNSAGNALTGNSGNNVLDGGSGNDTLVGAAGNDTFYVDTSRDVIVELLAGGSDTVLSTAITFAISANIETLILFDGAITGTGNALSNELVGNANSNVLSGGAGNDVLRGGQGYDLMTGGTGNDVYYVNRGDGSGTGKLAPFEDQVVEAANGGTDTVYSSMYTYLLDVNVENLVLEGVARKGFGNALNNAMTGNAMGNTLEGGAGNDTLNGGTGVDRLTGGAGNDSFAFDNFGGVDRVLDFNPADDAILLSLAVFAGIGTVGNFDASVIVSNSAPVALDPNDRILYNSDTGALYYDADGSGAGGAVQFAQLNGAPELNATDIAVS